MLPPKPKLNEIIRDLRQEIKGRAPLGRVQSAWADPSAGARGVGKRLFQGSGRTGNAQREPSDRRASDVADPEWNPSCCSDAEDSTEELRHIKRKANKRKQVAASSEAENLRMKSMTPEQVETAEGLFVAKLNSDDLKDLLAIKGVMLAVHCLRTAFESHGGRHATRTSALSLATPVLVVLS